MNTRRRSDNRGRRSKINPSVRIRLWLSQGATFFIRLGEVEVTFPKDWVGLDKRYCRRLISQEPFEYIKALNYINGAGVKVGETFGVPEQLAKKIRKDLMLDVFGEFTKDKAREIRDKIVELGLQHNDITALKLACQYISESTATYLEDLVNTNTVEEVLASQDIILKNVAAGDISSSFALDLMKMLDMKLEAIRVGVLEPRLLELEATIENGSAEKDEIVIEQSEEV